MLFSELVSTSSRIAATRKRTQKVSELAACLRRLESSSIEIGVTYLSGAVLQRRTGISYATIHDLRGVEPAASNTLTLLDVNGALERIAGFRGQGSASRKREELGRLLSRATALEQHYICRLLVGEIRQGALESLVIDGLAVATGVPAAALRRARMLESDLGAVARVAMEEGAQGLGRFRIAPFKPIQPMLANTADDMDDALARLGTAVLDYKLDGARVQVHRSGGDVRAYSRRMNDVTEAVPELVEEVLALPVESIILDGETLAMRGDAKPHPFQTTMRRFGRRLDVAAMRAELPLTTFYFDCLMLDGQTLVDEGTVRRAEALQFAAGPSVVPRLVTDSVERAHAFLKAALSSGHEGVMAKSPDAGYQAGGRGSDWLKIKHSHTLDLVVLAAEWGSGRRKGWLSNLHLGAREPATGEFAMLGKTFKGLTDAMLQWQTRRLLELEIDRQGPVVRVRPELVVEIAFNDVQRSPHYPAGMALRFARVKAHRPDKGPEQADTVETVRRLHAEALE